MAEVRFEYEPRELFSPYHARDKRWAAIVAHRRAGKTVACINDLIARAVYTQKSRPRYSYIAPYYSQAKEIAWAYLKAYTGEAAKKHSESSLTTTLFNDAKISLFGADNPDALRGVYNDGVILDEYGDCRPSLWGEVVLPTLADRQGWATFIGSAKGKNHFYEVVQRARTDTERWFHMTIRASESGLIPEEELEELRLQMSEEQYQQEMECDFSAAVMGTYYAKLISLLESDGRIYSANADWDPDQPVQVATDLGYTDSTSMWFWQHRPDGVAIIDYEEAHGESLPYYFSLLEAKKYNYEAIWLPHDSKAKSLQTGRSTIEQFTDAFPGICRLVPNMKIQHGIDAVRLILPYCHFHERTSEGVEGLRAYRRRWDENKRIFADQPVHDWASHPSDAFRYFALVTKTRLPGVERDETQDKPFAPILRAPEYRLEELFAARERQNRWNVERI